MLSSKQNFLYWRLWRNACLARGWSQSDQEQRHEVQFQALGYHKSHGAFDNAEFDIIKQVFTLLANPDDLDAVLFLQNPEQGERKRLLWRIKTQAPEPYIKRISADRFGTIYWEELNNEQLEQLRNTLTNRTRAHKRKAKAGDRQERDPVPAGDQDQIPF